MNLVRDILGTSFGVLIAFSMFSISSLNSLAAWQKGIVILVISAALIILWGNDYLQ